MINLILILLPLLVPVFLMCSLYSGSPTRMVYFFHIRTKYNKNTDEYLRLVLGKVEAGLLTAKADTYQLEFSNGITVWMENRYYASGKLYSTGSHGRMTLMSNTAPSYEIWRELIHMYAEMRGWDERTFLQKRFGKYKTIKKSKKTKPVVLG